jgi:hypothetical protein
MIRFASALLMGAFIACAAAPVAAQQTTPAAPGASAGQNCKKVYVQKKSQRTGKYVHVPRQRCA